MLQRKYVTHYVVLQRGCRFRYDCKGQSHRALPGENSDKKKIKSYPTVQVGIN